MFAAPVLAASWETPGFYSVRGKLIRPGMLMADVLKDAGEPVERKTPGAKQSKSPSPKKESSTHTGNKPPKPAKIEIWTYRRADGMYALIFGGGRLNKIEVTPFRDL